jgi:hypothetical protein
MSVLLFYSQVLSFNIAEVELLYQFGFADLFLILGLLDYLRLKAFRVWI